jgi:phage terminase large subunit-like protein
MLGPRFNANRPAVPGVVLPESRNVDETPKSLTFLAGVDLSVRRDHTGVVVVGVDAVNQRIRLAEVHHWRPTRGKDIDLQVVEDTIADVHRRFRLTQVNYDPAQAAFLSQRLTRRGVPMKEVPFTAANCSKMRSSASTLGSSSPFFGMS